MLKTHDGDAKGFSHLSRAWYGNTRLKDCKSVVDEVTFGFYSPDGGTSGEITMIWKYLGGEITPCLKVWCDGWHALYQFCDVLKKMAEVDNENIVPERFCNILLQCGFRDMTATKIDED